ncbi:DUF456 domain-containing protein [Leptolinea tardivitalis]|uniref:DUF456 domain-containing protein n=1 Tax=Leptolinea tardivitalis TaxID=229920 RepID=A0A0P6WNP3_9CHLR|nr:DUF456 domain-containing protein [Leptolinea tardivitalis]KPL71670.1 hypothetical protein ADM99_09355 [Leptolinea tardivitalis]GAP20009.1 hypothetical protein LTAR_00193 [Leptolinea tardivitalis]
MNTVALAIFQSVIFTVMVLGLLSLLTNLVPGLVIIWAGALVYGIYEVITKTYTIGGIILFVAITGLMAFGSVVDNILMGATAKQAGASWLAIGLSMLAGIAGSFIPFLFPFGGLVCALAALFIVEVIRLKNWRDAMKSTKSMMVGCGFSILARFGIGILMILLWLIWVVIG